MASRGASMPRLAFTLLIRRLLHRCCLFLFRPFDAEQSELLRTLLAVVHPHGVLLLRQVYDTGFVSRDFLVTYSPSCALRLFIDRTIQRFSRVGQRVVVVAPDDALLVNGKLKNIVGGRLLALDHG